MIDYNKTSRDDLIDRLRADDLDTILNWVDNDIQSLIAFLADNDGYERMGDIDLEEIALGRGIVDEDFFDKLDRA